MWNEKFLRSKVLKLVGLSERSGDQVLTNVMRLLESGGTSKDRRWEYGKQIAHFCRILGRFFGTKWKTAGKEGYCSLRGNDSRQVLLSKRQNMTPLPFLQKKKRKRRILSFLKWHNVGTFVVFPRFHRFKDLVR